MNRLLKVLEQLGGTATAKQISKVEGVNLIPGDVATQLSALAKKGKVIHLAKYPSTWQIKEECNSTLQEQSTP